MSKLTLPHHLQSGHTRGSELNLSPFELFNHVKAGWLHPLDKDSGRPIPQPDVLKIKKRLEEIAQEIKVLPLAYGKLQTGTVMIKGSSSRCTIEHEKQRLDKRAKELQKEQDSLNKKLKAIADIHDWTTYDPPEYPQNDYDILQNAYFHNDETKSLNIDTPVDNQCQAYTKGPLIAGYKLYHWITQEDLKEAVLTGQLTAYTNIGKKINAEEWNKKWTSRIKEADQLIMLASAEAKQQGIAIDTHNLKVYLDILDFPPESQIFIIKYREENFTLSARKFFYKTNDIEVFLKKRERQEHNNTEIPSKASAPTEESTQALQTEPQAENYFKRNGDFWTIRFQGKESKPIKHVNGLLYIAYLLERPGTSIDSLKLYNAVTYNTPDKTIDESAAIDDGLNVGNSKQVINDKVARNAYWKNWHEYQDNIDNAEDTPEGNMVKNESLQKQKELERWLKVRNFTDEQSKKQTLIHGLLKTAYKNIKADHNMNKCADHLKTQIKTDGTLGYIYNGETKWKISL